MEFGDSAHRIVAPVGYDADGRPLYCQEATGFARGPLVHRVRPVNDLTARRFGRLVAVRDTGKRVGHDPVWEFACDCGNTVELVGRRLTRYPDRPRSCGCIGAEREAAPKRPRGRPVRDRTGEKFGTLMAIRDTGERRNTSAVWLLRCDCGREVEVPANRLGGQRNCGPGCTA